MYLVSGGHDRSEIVDGVVWHGGVGRRRRCASLACLSRCVDERREKERGSSRTGCQLEDALYEMEIFLGERRELILCVAHVASDFLAPASGGRSCF
jgi:hypothetical protein